MDQSFRGSEEARALRIESSYIGGWRPPFRESYGLEVLGASSGMAFRLLGLFFF